jgi:hypothetical protein
MSVRRWERMARRKGYGSAQICQRLFGEDCDTLWL